MPVVKPNTAAVNTTQVSSRRLTRACSAGIGWCGWLLKAVTAVLMLLVMVGTGFLLWVSTYPVDISFVLPRVNSTFAPYQAEIQAEKLTLSFKRRFIVQAERLTVTQPNVQQLQVQFLEIALANRGLLVLQLQPKHIQLQQMVLRMHYDSSAPQPLPDVVAVLEQWEDVPQFRSFRTATMRDVQIGTFDQHTRETAQLVNGAMNLTRYPQEGLRLTATGQLNTATPGQRPETAPSYIQLSHQPGTYRLAAKLELSNTKSSLFAPYLPPQVAAMLQTEGRVRLLTDILPNNQLGEPRFGLSLQRTSFTLPTAYAAPLEFQRVDLEGQFLAAEDRLEIIDFSAETASGWPIAVRGDIQQLQQGPIRLNLNLTAGITSMSQVLAVLPEVALPDTVPWLRERLAGAATVANLSATFVGEPAQIPNCGADCGLSLFADIRHGGIQPFAAVAPLTDVQGTLEIQGDSVIVKADSAQWGQQQVRGTRVDLAGIFTAGDNTLTVTGAVRGEQADLLDKIQSITGVSGIPSVQAQHDSRFTVVAPLFNDPKRILQISDLKVNVNSTLTGLHLVVAELPDYPLVAQKTHFELALPHLRLQADGTLGGVPIRLDYRQNLAKKRDGIRATAQANLPPSYLRTQLPPAVISFTQSVATTIEIEQKSLESFTFSAVAPQVFGLNSPALNWSQQGTDGLQVELEGEIRPMPSPPKGPPGVAPKNQSKNHPKLADTPGQHTTEIEFGMINISGPGVEVLGSVYVTPGEQWPRMEFSPFKVGQHDLSLKLTSGMLDVRGEMLDLRHLDILNPGQSVLDLPAMLVSAKVETVLLHQGGALHHVQGLAERTAERWRNIEVKAEVRDNPVTLRLKPLNGAEHLRIDAADVGALLQNLGIYQGFRRGRMTVDMSLAHTGTGQGYVLLEDARAVELPIIFGLLDLLSLQAIIDRGEGLGINSLRIPLELSNSDTLYTPKAVWDGESLDMTFSGYYAFPQGQSPTVNVDGRLIPGVGLNQTISRIPLIGDILAGSQDGLLVADFKIKGNAQDPEVSVKPLSLITPGLLKDIFR